ncbi:MAG: ABC transporter permease [Candidatus Obscuribacterales bacterium]|nr:ABC transporter permease [Steroidobacteraceae bacterium]
MKYFMLIWAGLWRKKTRTIFTMLSVIVAFLLFGLLQGFNLGFINALTNLNVSRLFTSNKYSMVEGMPIAHVRQIDSVKGVNAISHLTYFGGFYQDKRNSINVFAADVPVLFELYKELGVPREFSENMKRTRTGAIISRSLADRFGWKIGDKVPIGTSIWTKKDGRNDYQFDIAGIYEGMGPTGPDGFYINFDYFDEERSFGNGGVHYFIIGVDDPLRADAVTKEIDALFANSNDETKTQTEQAFAASQIKQLGDINFIVNSIVGAVLFTLLFLTGNTMMQSMRERIPELAVLKTLGFSDAEVSTMVLFESILLCVFSALVGLTLASIGFLGLRAVLGPVAMPVSVILLGVGIAAALAIVSGLPPALRAKRLNIVDALAGR